MQTQLVSIILVNYNGKQFNSACIESILKQTYQHFEIIFVDNASHDGSVEIVEREFAKELEKHKIKIIKSKINSGFSWGNSLGAHHSSPESAYVCLLNNDTTVPPNRLEELIQWIWSDENLWAVASVILDKGYEQQIMDMFFSQHTKPTISFFWESTLSKIPSTEQKTKIFYTSCLSWCSFLYKKELINEPFPEYYFAYAEDVLLSREILLKNRKLAYIGTSFVNHFGSGSFGKKPSVTKLFHWNKNQILNFLLTYHRKTQLVLLPLFIIKECSHLFLSSWLERFIAKIKARKRILANRSVRIKTRREIQQSRLINDRQFLKQLSYKLSDDIYYARFSGIRKKLIWLGNGFFWLYARLFGIPHRS